MRPFLVFVTGTSIRYKRLRGTEYVRVHTFSDFYTSYVSVPLDLIGHGIQLVNFKDDLLSIMGL